MFFRKKKPDIYQQQTELTMLDIVEECNQSLLKNKNITHMELCSVLQPCDPEILKHCKDAFDIIERNLQKAIDKIVDCYIPCQDNYAYLSCNTGDEDPCHILENVRPISGRENNCGIAVLVLLTQQNFIEAYHELYNLISDYGYAEKYPDRYLSCNEYSYFMSILTTFLMLIQNRNRSITHD